MRIERRYGDMGRLLFESKGIATKAKVIFTVCSILLAVIGSFIIIIANMKSRARGVYSSINGGMQSYMGSYGGGYVLSEKGRTGFQLFGIIMVVLGILVFFNMLAINKSYLRAYEDGVKGLSVIGLLVIALKKEYDLEYSEIEKVQLNRNQIYGDTVTVWAHGERYGLLVDKNADELVRLIKQRMR